MLTKSQKRDVRAGARMLANCEGPTRLRRRRSRQKSNIDEVLGLRAPSTASKRVREREAEDQGMLTNSLGLEAPSTARPRKRRRKRVTNSRRSGSVPVLSAPGTARPRSRRAAE